MATTRSRAPRKAAAPLTSLAALAETVDRLAKGAILVVFSHAELTSVRRLVQVRCGDELAGSIRIIAAPTEADEAPFASVAERIVRGPFLASQRAYAAALAQVWRF